jgi:hypothetical protein
MTNNAHCDEFADRLGDLLERDVDETTRAALESHALSCGDCGPLLADLRKLRIDASNLPVLAPSRDLWSGVAERIDAPVIPLHSTEAGGMRRGVRWPRWGSLAAVAVLLIALTSTSTYVLTVRSRVSMPTATVASQAPTISDSSRQMQAATSEPAPLVASRGRDSVRAAAPDRSVRVAPPSTRGTAIAQLASSRRSAEQVYADEISRLHAIVQRRRAQLDPVTVSVIERNLKVIDDAIAQCKLALAKDPASRFLMESLNSALETKVELLRTATMLPARS